jgi:hypothetical protein
MLCQYKDYFGSPNQGFHAHFMGIAYMDVFMTIIAAEILSYIFDIGFILVLISLFLSGIFAHRLFCVRTTVDKYLFP